MTGAQSAAQRKLVICFIVRALPVQRLGGLENHARDLALALADRGHEIHLMSTRGATGEKFSVRGSGSVTVHEVSGSTPGDYSFAFYRNLKPALQLLCRDRDLDFIVPVDLTGLFLNPQDFSVRVIPLIHGTLTSEVPLDWRYWQHLKWTEKAAALWRYKSRIALLPVFRRMVNRATALLVDSEFTRRELLFALQGRNASAQRLVELGQRIEVVSLGIDATRYPATDNRVEPYRVGDTLKICLLGRLQRIKGIPEAICAAKILQARGVAFEMNIGGSGNFAEDARRLIAINGLEKQVRLVGRIEPEDFPDFLCAHHVFLFPDLTQPAFGLVAIEAMQYGVPVIAGRVGAVPEVVTAECGWLYESRDPGELAALIARLADDPDALAIKAKGARLRSEYYTAELMGERTEKVLLMLLEK